MNKNIFYIDILKSDVYLEYTNRDFEYISFTKAKKLIFQYLPTTIQYECIDSEKSVDFLNKLLTKYLLDKNSLILKK